jgi:hypothetical protein
VCAYLVVWSVLERRLRPWRGAQGSERKGLSLPWAGGIGCKQISRPNFKGVRTQPALNGRADRRPRTSPATVGRRDYSQRGARENGRAQLCRLAVLVHLHPSLTKSARLDTCARGRDARESSSRVLCVLIVHVQKCAVLRHVWQRRRRRHHHFQIHGIRMDLLRMMRRKA